MKIGINGSWKAHDGFQGTAKAKMRPLHEDSELQVWMLWEFLPWKGKSGTSLHCLDLGLLMKLLEQV